MKEDPEFNIYFVSLIEKRRCIYDFTCAEYTNRYAVDCAWESISEDVSEPVAECKDRWKNLRACYTRYLKLLKYPSRSRQRKKPYYLAQCLEFLKPYTKTKAPTIDESNKSRVESEDPSEAIDEKPFMVYEEEDSSNKEECYSFVPTGFKLHHDDESNLDQSYHDEDNPIEPTPIEKKPFPIPSSKTYENVTVAYIPNENVQSYETSRAKKRPFLDTEDPDVLFLKSIIPDIKEMTLPQKRAFRIGVLNLVQSVLSE